MSAKRMRPASDKDCVVKDCWNCSRELKILLSGINCRRCLVVGKSTETRSWQFSRLWLVLWNFHCLNQPMCNLEGQLWLHPQELQVSYDGLFLMPLTNKDPREWQQLQHCLHVLRSTRNNTIKQSRQFCWKVQKPSHSHASGIRILVWEFQEGA